jgi:hypothetical protein
MLRALVFVPILILAGCDIPQNEVWATDQNMRRQLFKDCMAALPAGPVKTHYNDWDEVVSACDSAAYYQARYCAKNCVVPSGKSD